MQVLATDTRPAVAIVPRVPSREILELTRSTIAVLQRSVNVIDDRFRDRQHIDHRTVHVARIDAVRGHDLLRQIAHRPHPTAFDTREQRLNVRRALKLLGASQLAVSPRAGAAPDSDAVVAASTMAHLARNLLITTVNDLYGMMHA